MSLTKRACAEFVGTFWLVFGGCGSAVLAAAFPELGIGFAGVALAFGLPMMEAVYVALALTFSSTIMLPSSGAAELNTAGPKIERFIAS